MIGMVGDVVAKRLVISAYAANLVHAAKFYDLLKEYGQTGDFGFAGFGLLSNLVECQLDYTRDEPVNFLAEELTTKCELAGIQAKRIHVQGD